MRLNCVHPFVRIRSNQPDLQECISMYCSTVSSYWSHTFQYLLTRFVWSVGQIDVTGHVTSHVGFTARAWLHDQTAGMSAMLHPSNPVYHHIILV